MAAEDEVDADGLLGQPLVVGHPRRGSVPVGPPILIKVIAGVAAH